MSETQIYNTETFEEAVIASTLKEVITILEERGYNPINQIVGYLMSGDPGYITNHKEARNRLTKIDRDKLLGILIKNFIGN